MLVDNIRLIVFAGNGGRGAATFRRDAITAFGGPDGGNGGNGGHIYFQGSTNIHDLAEFRFKKKIMAEHGVDGAKHNAFGRNAPHLTILVPLGTHITDNKTGESIEITDTTTSVLLAHGGKGGLGNVAFKSATNRTPTHAEPGEAGERKDLHLELKLIAEIGLIGLPNAGKSSLLAALTNATPVIANYPFTTLEPNIGMMGKHPIADIPGLIEGAASGKGLGTKFLRHIEKTKLLVHVIDVTHDDPKKAYKTIRKEFDQFNKELTYKPEIIFLNKTDLVDETHVKEVSALFTKPKQTVISGSAQNKDSVLALQKILVESLETH